MPRFDGLVKNTSFVYAVGRLGGDDIKLFARCLSGVREFTFAGSAEAAIE